MYISIGLNEFDPHHIIISEKTKNNIMIGSDFHRLIYSDNNLSDNGLFIHFNLKNINIEKYFNKVKCIFESSSSIFDSVLNKFLSNIFIGFTNL